MDKLCIADDQTSDINSQEPVSFDDISYGVNENAEGRESTTYYELKVKSKDNLDGFFNSMIAEQSGTTIWQRTPFH